MIWRRRRIHSANDDTQSKWFNSPVQVYEGKLSDMRAYIQATLWKCWGFKAAIRFFHIAHGGEDVEIAGQYKGSTPTTVAVYRTKPVPAHPKKLATATTCARFLPGWQRSDETFRNS